MRYLSRAVGTLVAVGAAVFAVSAGAAVAATAPTSRSAPTVEGKLIVGATLSAGNGQWNNDPTSFTYQWLRCAGDGTACSNVSGATNRNYTLTKTDVGHAIVVLVTAKNSAGSSPPTNSKPTDPITPAAAPTASSPPTITGKPFVGEQLVADPGKYGGGAVDKFAFQWRRCDASGGGCTDISGATAQAYGVLKADVGHSIRVDVTARNGFGSTVSESKATAAIKNAPPPTPVTTTIDASGTETICCQSVTLTGTVSTHKAGETVTILGFENDDIVSSPLAVLTTDQNGDWATKVIPKIETSYVAQTSTSKSNPLTVQVHPRLGLGVNGNNFSAKITARDTFAGAVALFQTRTAAGGWHTVQLVVTNLQSVARFHVNLRRGKTYFVRIYLPQRQAGPGYLDGVSHVRRVGGAS
jgi:hypothetical protein